jgi:curli biogenesis system outer membrane secretion channel CsgG
MKLGRFLPTCVVGLALLSGGLAISVDSQAPAAVRKPRVAVMDFDYGTVQTASAAVFGTNVDVGKGITNLLVTDMVKDGNFSVIERTALDKVLNEQNFSNSNRADPNSAAKIGKLLGVDAIVVGTITEFGNETKKTGMGGGGGGLGGFGLGGFHHSDSKANVAITARIINIDTGEIMAVADGSGQSSRSSTSLLGGGGNWHGFGGGNADFGSSDFQQTIIGEATKNAVQLLATNLDTQSGKVPVRTIVVEGVVAAVDSGQIILNVGAKAGVKVGDQFNVLRVTKEIKDPTTGAVLRKLTNTVGVVKATDVDDVSAICSPVSGTDFKVGDVIKTTTQ